MDFMIENQRYRIVLSEDLGVPSPTIDYWEYQEEMEAKKVFKRMNVPSGYQLTLWKLEPKEQMVMGFVHLPYWHKIAQESVSRSSHEVSVICLNYLSY